MALQKLELVVPSGEQQMAVSRLVVQVVASMPKISVFGLVNVSRNMIPQVSCLTGQLNPLKPVPLIDSMFEIQFCLITV